MAKICSKHLVASIWKEGTSKKTGKDYAFWACPEQDNGEYCQSEQIEGEPKVVSKTVMEEKTDWDAIAKGKVRHGVVVAVIEHGGLEALKGQLSKIDKIVDYIITGEPATDNSGTE